jgi:hypothetical protein
MSRLCVGQNLTVPAHRGEKMMFLMGFGLGLVAGYLFAIWAITP